MPINVTKIIDQTNSLLTDSDQNTQQLTELVGTYRVFRNNTVNKVYCIDLLPDATLNTGRLFYIEDTQSYVYSTGTEWTDDFINPKFVPTTLWSWGFSGGAVIGDGYNISRCSPVQEVCSSIEWNNVSVGRCHSAATKCDGTLWAWGCGCLGVIGDGTTTTTCSPVQEICSDTTWCYVTSGTFHTNAIKSDGTLWGWGFNGSGRVGDGTVTTKCSPVQEFCSDTTWCQASSGGAHTAGIKTNGTLWAWGCGSSGQIGDGLATDSCSPVQEVCSDTTWCAVSTGFFHSTAIKTSGTLWSWGSGTCGRLGDGTTVSKCSPVQEFCSDTTWCQVGAGYVHAVAVKTNGTLWAWGCGLCGRLGDGELTDKCSPVQEFCSDTTWCQASGGGLTTTAHSAAIKTSGTLWSWGLGNSGRLGDGFNTDKCSPIQEFFSDTTWCQVSAGNSHTAAIKAGN